MKNFIALSLVAVFAAAAGAPPRRPEPRPPAPPTNPTQPYPCIVGIVFIDGVPTLELICAEARGAALSAG